jgi:hypothetical protein
VQDLSTRIRHGYQQTLPIDGLLSDATNAQKMPVSRRSLERAYDLLALGVVSQQVSFVIR